MPEPFREPPGRPLRVAIAGMLTHGALVAALVYVFLAYIPRRQDVLEANFTELSDGAMTVLDLSVKAVTNKWVLLTALLIALVVEAGWLYALGRERRTEPWAWFTVTLIAVGLFAALCAVLMIVTFPYHNLNDALVR